MAERTISHAFVIPDQDFADWLEAAKSYITAFERVAVVRSPAGNDLNRYRNVTAVEAPLTWFEDDALKHIRRFYPMVVRVDVIRVQTPQELVSVLQQRVNNEDRYGEDQSDPVHLYDRFILEWATTHRPMNIVRGFEEDATNRHEGMDIETQVGAEVIAATAGRVMKMWNTDQSNEEGFGQYVEITSQHDGQTYSVTYAGLRNIEIDLGQEVAAGDKLAEAAGEQIKIVVQNPSLGQSGFIVPFVVDPTPLIYVQGFRVRPTADGLRIRSLPSTDGKIEGQAYSWEELESLEPHGRTLVKLGVKGQWLRVRMPGGTEGFTAAWFLQATTKADSVEVLPGVNPVGVNLDQLHPLGTPDPSRLGSIGWVRFGYNVSNNVGSQDIHAAFNRYRPLAEKYVAAGYKVMFATSHQTYGEGRNEFWPWSQMNDQKWARLIDRFVDMMGQIAQQWAGTGLVDAWQVWNEQDAPIGAVASVPMLAYNYAKMMSKVIPAIKSADPDVFVITGGHTGGPGRGSEYARNTIKAMPGSIRPDGIAFHPYGRGVKMGTPYTIFGHIDDSIREFGQVLPDKPLWITEWGVLDRGGDNPASIADYALGFIKYLKDKYPGRIATMIWYAWAQSMHNGYGIVDTASNPRSSLTERFLQA